MKPLRLEDVLRKTAKIARVLLESRGVDEELKDCRSLDDDMSQPVRLLRLPLWARIACRHGHAKGALDPEGRVVYTGPRSMLRAYYEAAGIEGSYRSFLETVIDSEGNPFSYRSGITTGPLVSLPIKIEEEFQKTRKR